MVEQHALILDDPWRVDDGDFPDTGNDEEKLLFLVNYAVLAPSILNVQPWRFRIDDGAIDLWADRSRILPVVDPAGRQLTISCGAALLNLRVAARAFGFYLKAQIVPDAAQPDLLARARLVSVAPASETERGLRAAIRTRRTHRAPFESRRPGQRLLRNLSLAARQEGATLSLVHRADDKRRVAELVAQAERLHLEDANFRRELANWLNRRLAEGQTLPDETSWGLSGAAGYTPSSSDGPNLLTQRAANIARRFASPDTAAEQQYAFAEIAPVLALLTTKGDAQADWMTAGQSLQRALLTGAVAGLSASYLNPPIERTELRQELAPIFGDSGYPQVLLRMGYGQPKPPSPRRPVSEVVGTKESR